MKLKRVDNYTWAVLLFVIGIYLGVSRENKSALIGWSISAIGLLLAIWTRYKSSGEIVENEYKGELAIKREEGKEPEIFSNKALIENIDGAATAFDKYRVFKLHNGIKAKVLPSGELIETTWFARLMNTGYTAKLRTEENWKPLYEVAEKL